MSRSYKHTNISAHTTAESEKKDKRIANKKYRRKVRELLRNETYELPLLREVSNVFNMDKDGKAFFDVDKHPQYLRK